MNVSATLKYARLSAQKARLVADQIRGLSIEKALNVLNFSPKKAAVIIKQVLRSAIANADHNHDMDIDELVLVKILVNEAPVYKRFKARAKGRSNRILKRNCHITVVVDEAIN